MMETTTSSKIENVQRQIIWILKLKESRKMRNKWRKKKTLRHIFYSMFVDNLIRAMVLRAQRDRCISAWFIFVIQRLNNLNGMWNWSEWQPSQTSPTKQQIEKVTYLFIVYAIQQISLEHRIYYCHYWQLCNATQCNAVQSNDGAHHQTKWKRTNNKRRRKRNRKHKKCNQFLLLIFSSIRNLSFAMNIVTESYNSWQPQFA